MYTAHPLAGGPPGRGQWRGISFSTLYGTNHRARLELRASDYVACTAGPPACAVVLLDQDKVVVHTRHFPEDDADIHEVRSGRTGTLSGDGPPR